MKKSVSKSKGKKNQKNQKDQKGFILLLSLVCFIGLGIGYAALTQTLNISNKVQFGGMSWNVDFVNGKDAGGSAPAVVNPYGENGIEILCKVEAKTASQTCIATVDVKNESSFPIILNKLTIGELEGNAVNYIDSIQYTWESVSEGSSYAVGSSVAKDQVIPKGATQKIKVTITTKELNEDLLPDENGLEFSVASSFEWLEHSAQ